MADRPAATISRKRLKPGRKRRVAGWSLLVIGVLITGVWGASGWWCFGGETRGWRLVTDEGVLRIVKHEWRIPSLNDSESTTWYAYRSLSTGWLGLVPTHRSPGEVSDTPIQLGVIQYKRLAPPMAQVHLVRLVLWPFALASLLGGGWLVWSGRRAKRRAMTGVCLKCGYDLVGLAAGAPCPECGGGGGGGGGAKVIH